MLSRPRYAADLELAILLECGHRCAHCGRACSLQQAFIVPWHVADSPSAVDLICLCEACEIERNAKTLTEETLGRYKQDPWVRQQSRGQHIPKGAMDTVDLMVDTRDVAGFDRADVSQWLLQAVAAFLDVSLEEASVVRIEKGHSVKVTLSLPRRIAARLVRGYGQEHARLIEFLEPILLVEYLGNPALKYTELGGKAGNWPPADPLAYLCSAEFHTQWEDLALRFTRENPSRDYIDASAFLITWLEEQLSADPGFFRFKQFTTPFAFRAWLEEALWDAADKAAAARARDEFLTAPPSDLDLNSRELTPEELADLPDLRELLEALPFPQKEVFFRHFFYREPLAAIGAEFGWTPKDVESYYIEAVDLLIGEEGDLN
jgi:hypothetical protein